MTSKPSAVVLAPGDFARGQRTILPESFIPRGVYVYMGDFARGLRRISAV